MQPTSRLLEAIAVTAEQCGKVFSPSAARIMAEDLSDYPEHVVMRALARCRKELTSSGAFTTGAVIARIDDGRPGAEEAWAMMPRDEFATVVWTAEMTAAWSVALPLLEAGEVVPARMAFREAYLREVAQAREQGRPVVWSISPGTDKQQRELVVNAAYEAGRIAADTAAIYLPALQSAIADARIADHSHSQAAPAPAAAEVIRLPYRREAQPAPWEDMP